MLCNNTSIPCNSLAVTYTDVTATTQCPATAQVTLPGGNTCINHADFQTGAFGFWVNPAATYYYSYTPPNGQTLGPYPVTGPGIGGGGGGQFTSLLTYGCDPTGVIPINTCFALPNDGGRIRYPVVCACGRLFGR